MSQFNVHEWNHKRRLGENKETLKEVTIFDEIDMMEKELLNRMGSDNMLRDLISELQTMSGGTRMLHMALKRMMNM